MYSFPCLELYIYSSTRACHAVTHSYLELLSRAGMKPAGAVRLRVYSPPICATYTGIVFHHFDRFLEAILENDCEAGILRENVMPNNLSLGTVDRVHLTGVAAAYLRI